MVKPTIHLNGTSASDLNAAYMSAWTAVNDAMFALAKCGPHGRDYYPQGDDAIVVAAREHRARMDMLRMVCSDLEELALSTQPNR